MTSCGFKERNLKESYLEIVEAMPLLHYALSTYLERLCSIFGEHSYGNVPELRRVGTTFDGEYMEAHPPAFQAILPLETFHKSLHSEDEASHMTQ